MSLAERIRKKMNVPAPEPKPVEPDKPPKQRKCCASVKGENSPHEPSCPTLQPAKPKATKMKPSHLGAILPSGWRWPAGTIVRKVWDGDAWHASIDVPDAGVFEAVASGSLKVEQVCTVAYFEWLKGKEGAK